MESSILNSISVVIEKLYSSVEGSIYEILDKLIDISSDIFDKEPLKYIFVDNDKYGVIFVATSLIIFYIIQFVIVRIIGMYNGNSTENVFKFIIRVVIAITLVSSSKYLCELALDINDGFTNVIEGLGKDITGQKISFVSFREVINNLEKYMGEDNVSLDGLIKGFISFGSVTLMVNYSVRYVTVIFLIIITPFAIMFSISNFTKGIFYSFLKLCIVNICQQWIVKLLLIIPISFKNIDSQMFKIIVVGTIYLLYKTNMFTREIFGNIYVSGGRE